MSVMTFFDATLVQALIANHGYAAVFVVVMLDSPGLPLPSETVLVCASVYAGSRQGLSGGAIIGVAACGRAGTHDAREGPSRQTGGQEGQ
jgi:membrane protein DedA with SNARE-associated domain